ncbi:MAG: ATP-binding protein [Mycoplasmataceae bacterium]|jgi:predicted AAA+ superfamily ATPase|nr:ATP-binding protein [Mycoplasmataceae bacterium]
MSEKFIKRVEYLDFLKRWQEKDVIKVISGVRRSGKSTLLKLFVNQLINEDIDSDQIQVINFEDFENQVLRNATTLYQHIKSKLIPKKMNYIFLDEIQHVSEFEKVVDSFYVMENVDVYMTGSNAYFLSGELATLLSGRYVELKMLPLSFKEFYAWKNKKQSGNLKLSKREWINEYAKSSFPYTLFIDDDKTLADYLEGIYSTILLKDVVTRIGVKDVDTLERVTQYLASIIGSEFVSKTVQNVLNTNGKKTSHETIGRFINALEETMFFYKARQYNIRGKRLLDTKFKYYLVDVGLRNILLSDAKEEAGHILENIIYLELLRRGNKVYVGKIDKYEIDFIAENHVKEKMYVQVALNTENPNTLERELRPLQMVNDQYDKYLITLDEFQPTANYEGIKKINAFDWLLND